MNFLYPFWRRTGSDLLVSAQQAAVQARKNAEARMNCILTEASDLINQAIKEGQHGVVFRHTFDAVTTDELHRRLKDQGYIVKPSDDPFGTYIVWLPVAEG